MKEETVKNLNVGLLGISFLLVMTGFQTMSNIQPIILDSARNETSEGFVPGFNGDGFVSLAIVYTVFTFANLIAPAFVSVIGPRITMIGNRYHKLKLHSAPEIFKMCVGIIHHYEKLKCQKMQS